MEIRRTPLPGHIEYTLDGATESNEIDGCTSTTLRLYGDPERLDVIVERPMTADQMIERLRLYPTGLPGTHADMMNNRLAKAEKLMLYTDEILAQMEPRRRGTLIHDGIRSTGYQINSISSVLSDWAMTDTIEGGCMEPFKKGRDIRLDRRGDPYPRTLRMICSPSFIRRYVKRIRTEEVTALRKSTDIQVARLHTVPLEYVRHDDSIFVDLDQQLVAFRDHRAAEVAEQERQLWRPENFGESPSAFRLLPTHMDPKRRKLLKRASKIASSVLGVQAVNALARGDKIKVEGPTITLQMQKRGLLTDFGHGQLSVAILDHSGVPLADLCIYQDKVPVIDQAVGFALMIQSGMEKELVEESNIIRSTAEGEKNELIAEKNRSAISLRGGVRQISGRWGYETHRQWRRRYWEITKQIWLDTVAVAVMGRNRKMFPALDLGR